MSKIVKDVDSIKRDFIEKFDRLKSECDNYDNGNRTHLQIEYMSATLRILLKDSRSCISLLEQLKEKENISFIDSSTQRNTMSFWHIGNNISNLNIVVSNVYMGLLVKSIFLDSEYKIHYKFEPLLNENKNIEEKQFDNWYKSEIYNDGTYSITRKKLIETIAEQDGGVHVDTQLEEDYFLFKKSDSLKTKINGEFVNFDNNPAFVSLRQIAFEVLESLKNLYDKYKNELSV